jgi:protocatechuate 3,4-dioxygenase beta subunit
VRVPSEAGHGKAKVTLSFPDWKDGNVTPATYEVPIVGVEPEAEEKTPPSAQGEKHLQKPEPKDGKDLDWKTVIVSKEEPGEPLIVGGVIYGPDGKTPVEGATVYVYHMDAKGDYGRANQAGPPRLQGRMRTNAAGKYEYRTIRPGGYPNSRIPQHIHYEIAAPGYQKEVTEIFFADDPRLTNEDRAAAKKKGGPPIVTLQRGKDAALRGVANFSLSRTKGSSAPKGDR